MAIGCRAASGIGGLGKHLATISCAIAAKRERGFRGKSVRVVMTSSGGETKLPKKGLKAGSRSVSPIRHSKRVRDFEVYTLIAYDSINSMTEEKPLPPAPKKLTAEQRSKVIEWIKNHAKKGCPVCGHATWQLGNDLVEIKQHYGAPVLGGYGVYPLVMFTCENCAHVFFFQAKRIGALEQRQPESKKDGD